MGDYVDNRGIGHNFTPDQLDRLRGIESMSATMTQESYHTVLEMAADAGETPLRYMVVELGWNEEDARKELIEAENKYLAY